MKFIIQNFRTIFVLLMGAFIVLLIRGCFKTTVNPESVKVQGKKYEVLKYITDTQYITKKQVRYIKGDVIKLDTTIYVNIPPIVDTLKILKDYYSINAYTDTLYNEFGKIVINDTITKNKILGRSYSATLKIPSVTNTSIVKQKFKPAIFIGVGAGVTSSRSINEISASIYFQPLDSRIFGIGFGINNNNPVYKLNALIKL